MYKILIVEDEYFIRKGIRNLIDYESINCTVVAEAQNGSEAMTILSNTEIDIVITDIKMPILDGLELLRKSKNESTSFIILSGFNEFEYAQEAIRLGASDYLLKPVEEKDLITAIENAKKDLLLKRLSNKLETEKNEVNNINLLKIYKPKEKDATVESMIDYVRLNYKLKFTMEDLTKQLHYSETTLNQKFRAVMGTTFNNYLNQYRIQKSMDLINSGIDPHDVYSEVGFADYKYFRIVFKKYTGITPSVYKNSKNE